MNKTMKPAGFAPRVAPAKTLTEEEKKVKIMQFLQQKREQFSINILCNLCQGQARLILDRIDNYRGDHIPDKDFLKANGELIGLDGMSLVETSVKMADHLIEELYPLPEDTDKSNK